MRLCSWWKNASKEERLKLREDKKYMPFSTVHSFFGDVHSENFEDWWKSNYYLSSDPGKKISDITNYIDELVWFFYEAKEKPEKIPLLLKKYNYAWVDNELGASEGCVLSISCLRDWKVEDLIKEFRKILKQYKKTGYTKTLYPTEPLRFNEVKRYLKIFCLRKEGEKKWPEILDILYPEIEENLSKGSLSAKAVDKLLKQKASLERTHYMDFKKAEMIIKNVEQGLFPGKY